MSPSEVVCLLRAATLDDVGLNAVQLRMWRWDIAGAVLPSTRQKWSTRTCLTGNNHWISRLKIQQKKTVKFKGKIHRCGKGRLNQCRNGGPWFLTVLLQKLAPVCCPTPRYNRLTVELTLYSHIKTAERRTAIQWLVHWPLMGGLLHSVQRGGAWAGWGSPSPLLAVPNVTAHPLTASVPTSYYLTWHYNCLWTLKGRTTENVAGVSALTMAEKLCYFSNVLKITSEQSLTVIHYCRIRFKFWAKSDRNPHHENKNVAT